MNFRGERGIEKDEKEWTCEQAWLNSLYYFVYDMYCNQEEYDAFAACDYS